MSKKKFTVTVYRTEYQSHDFEVEADTQEKAEEIALEEAYNHEFDSGDAEYETEVLEPNNP